MHVLLWHKLAGQLDQLNVLVWYAASECPPLPPDCVHVIGIHLLWRASVDVDCAEYTWSVGRYLLQKEHQWPVPNFDGPDSNSELRGTLARGSRALNVHVKTKLRYCLFAGYFFKFTGAV